MPAAGEGMNGSASGPEIPASTSSEPEITAPTHEDLEKVWKWNDSVPGQIEGCVHDLIAEITDSQPNALAVHAWDGDFTYSELDRISSRVSRNLMQLGITKGSSIPILFSKSRWTCIAMLAVIKTGSSAIALDATQPDLRLLSIVQQAKPQVIISSAAHLTRASHLGDVQVVQLDDRLLESLNSSEDTSVPLPTVSPSDIVYISFTSGTTGQPKGALISHANVRSAVQYQGQKLGFQRGTRVLDFAPYSFDVAWSNFLHTLCAGGCLCIPSEEDMLSDLSSAITDFGADLINVTPTLLRTISPIPPGLRTVLLSGEMPYRDNVTQWAGRVRLLNTYGPTECTFKCAFSVLSSSLEGRPDIGHGVGFATWVVDPTDDKHLAPVGSVGELYLEGPLVGQGYLRDPEKTASTFVEDPPWLLAGSKSYTGRQGRLYKTGDLVKYKSDGRLVFVGRKDTFQLKIRGQRVEIGDVEHHIRACLNESVAVIADVILPRGSDSTSLALFVASKTEERNGVKSLMDGLADKLRSVLPGFMIPSVYFPVDGIPVASTGKVDRRKLREMANAHTWEKIIKLQSTILTRTEYHEPSNEMERQLRHIWADVLGMKATHISTADSFLRLGGDSIAAMRVVAATREQKLSLTVADLFRTPILRDLAEVAKPQSSSMDDEREIAAFGFLAATGKVTRIREVAGRICGVNPADIEDIYPCTPLQQGMLAMSAGDDRSPRRGGDQSDATNYVSRTAFQLPPQAKLELLEIAWRRTTALASILRTRIIDLPDEGLVQVVVKQPIPLQHHSHISGFIEGSGRMGLGTPLCRAGFITGETGHLILEMHHAIFDGWSSALILDAIEAIYREPQMVLQPFSPLQPFIKHVSDVNSDSTVAFWRDHLADSEAIAFPSAGYHAQKKLDLHHTISDIQWPQTGITPSSVVHSALSLLLAAYTNSSDIKYGATVSGRSAPIAGIERIAAPTIATIPVRVNFDWDQTVEALQRQIQEQNVKVSQYEQFGLQRIRRIDDETEEASQFQLLLVVQPPQHGTSQKAGGMFSQAKSIMNVTENGVSDTSASDATFQLVSKDGQDDSMGIYNSYAMMIICQLEDNGVTLKINFDSGAIEDRAVQRITFQLEHLLGQLTSGANAKSKLSDMKALSKGDLDDIWGWNRLLPGAVEEPVTTTIDGRAGVDPDAIAICAWDKELTYLQLKDLTNKLARRLQDEGVGQGSIVVLSFEKSAWLAISMISVLKAGAVALPISTPTTNERAHEIVEKVKAGFAITSDFSDKSSFDGLIPTFSIPDLIRPQNEKWIHVQPAHHNHPSDPALVLFTSGSTGVPKAILWNHSNLSTNIKAHSGAFAVTSSSRVFQFAGYDFDVSTVESLSTLTSGGCLCIPSEADRNNRLAGAFNDFNANWLFLTPSVSESVTPKDLPRLKTMVVGGERLSHRVAFKWANVIDQTYNWYGPAEACVATSYPIQEETWKLGMSGKSIYGLTWLVDPSDSESLAPVGAIAELCIEGPIVARYTGDSGASLNESSFFTPSWLPQGHGNVSGRSGRLYKTGDLVRYDTEGRIVFLGRKQDSQRKLRGQRIELSEIEFHAQQFLSEKLEVAVVAEIFCPSGSEAETLALFVSPKRTADSSEDTATFVKRLMPVDELEAELLKFLPSYMIPKVYVPITSIPMGRTAKTDRRRLRQYGSSFTYEALAALQPSRRESRKPTTGMERLLQKLWGGIIKIDVSAINAADNFFRLGGDSISAMRLVASMRSQGYTLTVADVFQAPQLETMATRVKQDLSSTDEIVPPFSLLMKDISEAEARTAAAQLCSLPESRIVDVYPCTALQQGLLALGVKSPGQYVSRSVLGLQPSIDEDGLERAWLSTVEKLPLLRTRIVDLPGQGFVQVVLNSTPLESGDDIDDYVRLDEMNFMGPGTALCRAGLIDRNFILTIHHCTYDGNVLKMILDELESQYLGQPGMTVTPFKNFIQHLSKIDPDEAAEFWKLQLSSAEPRQFPVLPSATYEPRANEDLEHLITLEWPRTGTTPSTLIRAAWALLATQYTSSSDVIFAVTTNGRQTDMRGIENCVGPTISTVTMAISVDWKETVNAFLQQLQRQMTEITSYEQYGLQNIQRLHGDLDARLLQTLLVVQPIAAGKSLNQDSLLFKARSFSSNLDTLGTDPFNNYALMVVCELAKSGLKVRFSFDSSITNRIQISRMARQFETILRQMGSERTANEKLATVQTASGDDLDVFWAQNIDLPEDPDTTIPDLVALAVKRQPDAIAVDAWDGQFSYREVDELSTVISQKFMGLGVTKGSVVALNFEKSKWVPVVQLAVFKAAAVDVLLSTVVPDLRVGKVFRNIGVKLAVVSESRLKMVSQYAPSFTVDQLLQTVIEGLPKSSPQVEMEDPAAILVSSGSTGEPKQVLWSHRGLTANARAHGKYLNVSPSTRIFQFASYDFDVSTIESMSALIHMACLCIPSESERVDGTSAAINRFGVNFMNITPSTAKAIRPEDVPGIRILVLSGENLVEDDVNRWKGRCRILNWYGPAEHPATSCPADADTWHSGVVSRLGTKQPTLCWLVDPADTDRLVPLGAVGEIVLEGPLCSNGYVANDAMSKQRFRSSPFFLTSGHGPEIPGRSGRLYYSGDLGRYDTAGNLVYMGRKDAQLKIRGQLVAPEEVEYHIRRITALSNETKVVVDAVQSQYSNNIALVAFVGLPSEHEVERATQGLNEKLKHVLPNYAIPVYYIPVAHFPTNASAKIDRKRLQEIGASFDPSRQTSGRKRREPTTTAERTLRKLWSRALGVSAESIAIDDSFLRIGDSIQAMRLVGMARQQALGLTVAEVFEHPALEEMAKILRNNTNNGKEEAIEPFILLGPDRDVDLARQEAASLCGVGEGEIEDIFPCTPLQEGLLALTLKREGDYIGHNMLELAPSVDLDRFQKAWEQTISALPILRTRILELPDHGLVQAIMKHHDSWVEARDIEEYTRKQNALSVGLGLPLMRYSIFANEAVKNLGPAYFAMSMHHSIYDGLTTPLILETLESYYKDVTPPQPSSFQSFVKYIGNRDKDAETRFWKSQFTDLRATQFPPLPSSTYQPHTDSTFMYTIENLNWRSDNITRSTTIRAATALLLSQYTSSADVVFGVVSAGRKAPMGGIERLVGPTIATVPIRVNVDESGNTPTLLETLQREETKMIAFEQIGLSSLRKISDEAQQACQFQTLLVVQMPQESMDINKSSLFVSDARGAASEDEASYHGFQTYALSLICTPEEGCLEVRLCFDSAIINHETVQKLAGDFESLLRKLCSTDFDDAPLGDISLTTDQDLNRIWQWNAETHETLERSVHDLITDVALAQPDASAIHAWDGKFTYSQLSRITTNVAGYLSQMGVTRNTIIPIYFENSSYAIIALLSVIKAGGAGLLLDTLWQRSQLEALVSQVKPPVILCSPSTQRQASKLVANTLILGPETDVLGGSARDDNKMLPSVDPSDLLCVVLTSGTTGTPKCSVLQHRNFSSAIHHQRSLLGLNKDSRVYIFTTHGYDTTYWDVFHTFAAGGTVCIPSATETEETLTESIERYATTDVFITPSVARLVDPAGVPSLHRVYLGGEQVTEDDVTRWAPHAETFIAYGSAECSANMLYYKVPSPVPSALPLGYGTGVSTWIVDPWSSERLSPIGMVGELYLDGPLVGQGYLNDEDKTASSFIESPSWLRKGSSDGIIPGRSGRLYKSGDLVKYNPADGSIVFVGRKDDPVTIRGQRVDLFEVERHIRSCLTEKSDELRVFAEVVVPSATKTPTLVGFIKTGAAETKLDELIGNLEDALLDRLPLHMVPATYVPINSDPILSSGARDRQRLREMGAKLTLDQLSGEGRGQRSNVPSTEFEVHLQQLWETILGVSSDRIQRDSSFLRLGGDSISAMRMTALARSQGFSITVQNILKSPRLRDMAKCMTRLALNGDAQGDHIEPFSLLKDPGNKDFVLDDISKQCGVNISQIEDVFPCTSVQKSLLSMTAKSEGSYVARYSIRLKADVNMDRFKEAWETVSQTTAPILRHRIVEVPTEGLVQILLKERMMWGTSDDLDTYVERDQDEFMGLGTPLTRLAIVGDHGKRKNLFCFVTQHHAIYDGYSVDLLITEVSKAYAGVVDKSPVAPFQAFIKHIVGVDEDKTREFWRQQFADSEAVPFPALPDQDYRPKADSIVQRNVSNFKWPKEDATPSTIIKAAWSILTSRYTGSEDVVFGAMVTGRQAPIDGIDRIIAPLINAVPIRVKFDPQQSVAELLEDIQQQAISMIAYEHTELLDIRRISPETERGSHFNTLLIVQPPRRRDQDDQDSSPFLQTSENGPEFVSSRNGLDDFNPNAVMIMCQLTDTDELQLEISFDSEVVDQAQMQRIAAQFEHVLRQVCSLSTHLIEDIKVVSEEDIRELWNWNAVVPETINECVHDLIGRTMKRQPESPAICAWDGNLTYAELDHLSSLLASLLTTLGVGPGTIIPLCFEKSMWYPVAALGAMKAGAACVATDSTQPESRLKSIVTQINPKFLLSSASNRALANRLSDATVVIVDKEHVLRDTETTAAYSLAKASASDVLYVVFTSGSTGVPKGIVTTHRNFASAATHQADILHIRPGTRVFDFVSYSFDVSWSNHLHTLICGGCLCIPSETERKNDISGAINRMACDYAYFTPSVAKSLEPSRMPGVRTLTMGGEPILSREVARWTQTENVIGIYGPAECAQALSFTRLSENTSNGHIGHSYGARTWLVEPGRPDCLAAIGTIAELVIEGPTVSKGYFGDLGKTTTSYIKSPPWLSRGSLGHPGRQGTLYKTGDLLRYNSDGSLNFIGRKDGMIKLRGQRIELAEVEYHVRRCLRNHDLFDGVAAEIITPQNSTRPLLAAFFSLAKEEGVMFSEEESRSRLIHGIESLEENLWDQIPQYMIPGSYIYLDKIPTTATNKIDRRTLRALGSAKTVEQLAEIQPHSKDRRAPSTEMEKLLQALWASVLEIDTTSINAESSFLRIGGESIAAMRLVSAARGRGIFFTVADIFKAPRLCDLALRVKKTSHENDIKPHEPFALLETDNPREFLENHGRGFLDEDIGVVKDVVPATDFQELSVLQALQDPPGRYPHWIFDLPKDVDIERLEQACKDLVRRFDVLHTVFIQAKGRYWQVLLSDFKLAYDYFDAKDEEIAAFTNAVCEQDLRRPRKLGMSFIRFAAIKHNSGAHKLVLRISHAQFDGFSWGLLLQTLSALYNRDQLPSTPAFTQYISFIERNKKQSLQYWTSRLQGSLHPSWSASDPTDHVYSPADRLTLQDSVSMPDRRKYDGISAATIFHATCAIALSRHFQQQEVLFGRLVTGRSMLPGSLQNVVGPTMTEVPIRITVTRDSSLAELAKQLQSQFIEDSTREAAGMVEIIRNCTSWPAEARDFGWRTAFQQEEESEFKFLGEPSSVSFYQRDMPPRSRPEIYATPKDGKWELEFEGNRQLISEETVRNFFAQFKAVLDEH